MPKHISEVLPGEEHIVIAGGHRFHLASEDAPRFPRGYGGNPFLFKLIDSGKVIYSTNVWDNGESNEPNTAEIMEYKEWGASGISNYGKLEEHSSAYVFSDKFLVKQ